MVGTPYRTRTQSIRKPPKRLLYKVPRFFPMFPCKYPFLRFSRLEHHVSPRWAIPNESLKELLVKLSGIDDHTEPTPARAEREQAVIDIDIRIQVLSYAQPRGPT